MKKNEVPVNGQENASTEKVYPTVPDAEGFFYEKSTDEQLGIFTKIHENGSKVKKTILPVSNKVAIVRALKAKDSKTISRFTGNDQEKYLMANITVATTLDGVQQPFELYEELSLKDYTRLASMVNDLNF